MNLLEILLVSISLAVDAFVCSIIYGKNPCCSATRIRNGLAMATTFGLFQFFMPLIGYFGGVALLDLIEDFDHWVAFFLLAAVATNMVLECIRSEDNKKLKNLSYLVLLSLGIATSIDALAVGFSIGLIDTRIFYISTIIGITAFVISFIGFYLGQIFSRFKALEPVLNILGAVVLLSIGVIVLHEHGVF